MAIPIQFENCLRISLIASPMFFAIGIELVVESCKAGIVGTFVAFNQCTIESFKLG